MNTLNTSRSKHLYRIGGFGIILAVFCLYPGVSLLEAGNFGAGYYQTLDHPHLAKLHVSQRKDQMPQVSIHVENMQLIDVLHEIAGELGVDISINTRKIRGKTVSYQANNKYIYDVLYDLLDDTELEVQLSEDRKVLIIREKDEAEEMEMFQETVTGHVFDGQTGEALPGVNIFIDGTTTGTTSGADGSFELTVPSLEEILVFTYIGYERYEVNIDGRTELDVLLTSEIIAGEELVVIGYGTVRKSDLTGSVSSVRGDAITAEAISHPGQVLQGRAAGVQVVASGDPGSAPVIRIRGPGTTGDSDPLYVVDGLMVDDMRFLNTNDIESIEVLKDASATAIYGSRGANGVILVTTRQGTTSIPTFTFTMSEGIERAQPYEMVDAREYATLMNEGLGNIGQPPAFDLDQIDGSTDWFDEVFNSASIRNYNLAFSQGTERNSYYVGVGMHHQNGVIDKSGYQRYTVRVNNQYALSDHITVGHNLAGNWTHKDNRFLEATGWTYRIPPTVPVRNPDGTYTDTGISSNANVVAGIEYHNSFTKARSLVGNAFVNIGFLQNFQFRSSIGIDLQSAETTDFTPVFFVSNEHQNQLSRLSKTWGQTRNWLWENTINFNHEFDIHRIDAVAGFTAQERNFEALGGNRNNLFADQRELWYLNAGSLDGLGNFNEARSSGIVSYLGRVNYTLMDRYLFTGTLRIDGSSKFAQENRWGTFPSFAAGWRISEESFMQDVNWLSELKLRGSWGQIGNENIGDYRYFATAAAGIAHAGIFGNAVQPGAAITTLVNQNITWETSEQLDLGIEVALFDDRVRAEIDWYKRTTRDMLVIVGVPGSVGLSATEGNVGAVENKGFDFSIDLRGGRSNFYYNVGLTASTINNKVTDLGTLEEMFGDHFVTRAMVGEPIGFFYGYKSLGPFDTQAEIDAAPTQTNVQPGDLRMADINGDGMINASDRTNIGSPIPDYTAGLNITLGYSAFELSVDLYGAFGHDIFDANNFRRFSGEDNFSREWLDRWTGPGTSDRLPRLTFGGDWNYEVSSRWVHDASFVKIQNVRIQYTLPASILERFPVSEARVFVSGNNLHYFTKYPGFSPEVLPDERFRGLNLGIDQEIFPVSAFYQFGASITF